MTVVDTSAVIDYLLGVGVAEEVEALMYEDAGLAAPDVLMFEILAVLRRQTLTRKLDHTRACAAIGDLDDLSVELFPSLPLIPRAWTLYRNLTAGDALFVALAEQLQERFATKDRRLARELAKHTSVAVVELVEQ